MAMKAALAVKRTHRPAEEAKARVAKEKALALLRWHQVREKRKEWRRTVDAALAGGLAVIRDRLLAIPTRISDLTPAQREALRREIADALEAWSGAEL